MLSGHKGPQTTIKHYESILNVSFADIKTTYHSFLLKFQPDRMANAPVKEQDAGIEQVKEIINAYEVLSEPIARREYGQTVPRFASHPIGQPLLFAPYLILSEMIGVATLKMLASDKAKRHNLSHNSFLASALRNTHDQPPGHSKSQR
ncbi:hypothetical protein CC86DRAFT_16668 [Ophiobolus disseminans]|uniref:J domain-containing protein n=1 Tax=Ophiobolus disseminans TaxID=1469910 RepID=A0A6A7AL87_9PLEO|nr:hypothetical protein CC86DRAFT_16668 [Ophiobolus disseminans]